MAEKNSDGTWSDYIYANGQRIARADSFDARIHIDGTTNALGFYAAWDLSFSNYTIQPGDKIGWRQYQAGGAQGGISIQFTDGANTNWTTLDTDGQVMNSDTTQNAWHYRTVDLSAFAGKTANVLWISADARTPAGSFWNSYFADIAIYSTNGNVTPVYYRQNSTGFTYFSNGNISTPQASVEISNSDGDAEIPLNTTTYYHGDQIGSTRLLTAAAGWPVSFSNYYPFGQELSPPADNNHYKFTGKERDEESGLDYFGARYYASAMGRFLIPDSSAKVEPVPYANLTDPQSLNLYAYVRNNPLTLEDSNGHGFHWCAESGPEICNDDGSGILPATAGAPQAPRQNVEIAQLDIPDFEDFDKDFDARKNDALEPLKPGDEVIPDGRVPGAIYPGEKGPLSDKDAANFDFYLAETLKKPMKVYRSWGGSAGFEGRDGTYHSVLPPEGSPEANRQLYGILPEWGNDLTNTREVTIPAGTTIYIGPAAAKTSETGTIYRGGGLQVFVPK